MNTHVEKKTKNKSNAIANSLPKLQFANVSTLQFADNRPEAITQKKLHEAINNSPQAKQAAQLYAIANNSTSQPLQRKGTPEKAIQEKLPSIEDIKQDNYPQDNLSAVGSFGIPGSVLQKQDSDDDGYEDSDDDRKTWAEWSKQIKHIPGYTCWPGWHINWTLGDGDQYHVTEENAEKNHYFFTLGGAGKPITCAPGKGKGKNAYQYKDLPKRVKKFIDINWDKKLKQ